MRTSLSLVHVCEEKHKNLTRQKVWMDHDACMNDLSVLKAVLTLLSYPAAAVGGEEDKQLLGRRWVRGERRDFLTGVELGVDGWRQDTVGEGGERRDCFGVGCFP